MTVINNRGEGMTFVINNGTNLNKIFKITKYYPKASIKIGNEKSQVKISMKELEMLGLSEEDVDKNLILDKKRDESTTEKLTIKNLKKYFGDKIIVDNKQPLAS